MCKKILFKNGKVEDYTIVLSNRAKQHLGQLTGVQNVKFIGNLNTAQEISFAVYKHQLLPISWDTDSMQNIAAYQDYIWNNLIDFKLIWVKELNEYFEIRVTVDDSKETVKTINGISLCESELSQTYLYNLEVNSESDITRKDYDTNFPTVFYRDLTNLDRYSDIWNTDESKYNVYKVEGKNEKIFDEEATYAKRYAILKSSSLLHRILEKVPHYSLKTIDPSLHDMQRTFSVDSTSVYDFLVGECSEQFDCLFQFDSADRTISAYDIESFGTDTTIYVDKNNLTDSIHLEVDSDSMKNCFKLEAGDDLMTATVRSLNPNGSDYLYMFSEDVKKDMPSELSHRLLEYEKYCTSFEKECQQLTEQEYALLDEKLYYESSMMPKIETGTFVSAADEASKLTVKNLSPIALRSVTAYTSPETVNSALINYAKVFVKTGYVKLEIVQSNLDLFVGEDEKYYGTWTGQFKITNYSDDQDIAYSDLLIITVNDDYKEFVSQKVAKQIQSDDDDEGSLFNVLAIDNLGDFQNAIKLYSYNRLESFYDALDGVINVLIQQHQADKDAELYDLYSSYYDKRDLIFPEVRENEYVKGELDIRQEQIDQIQAQIDAITARREEIQNELDFEKYLDGLYPVFCAYRREDKFSNSNYISDGLDNAQLIRQANAFLEMSKKELARSSTGKCTITSTLYNLLALKEFQSLVEYFELGNRIHLKVDGQLYTLKLIGYEIDFNNLQTISVTFSTATNVYSAKAEKDIIIASAKSMATTYSSVAKQAEKGQTANTNMNSMLQNGLNSSFVQITNNAQEEVTYGKQGILCRSYDDISNAFDAEQLKITHNTIAYTNNNWKSVRQVIGKYNYKTYNVQSNRWDNVSGYGMVGDAITAGQVYGSTIVGGIIYSDNYLMIEPIGSENDEYNCQGTFIDLKNGHFSFGGELTWDGNNLMISDSAIGTSLQNIGITAKNLKVSSTNVEGTLKNPIDINGTFVVNSDGKVSKIILPSDTTLSWTQIKDSPNILSKEEVTKMITDTIAGIDTLNTEVINVKHLDAEELRIKTPYVYDTENAEYKVGVSGSYEIGEYTFTIIGGLIVDIKKNNNETT